MGLKPAYPTQHKINLTASSSLISCCVIRVARMLASMRRIESVVFAKSCKSSPVARIGCVWFVSAVMALNVRNL